MLTSKRMFDIIIPEHTFGGKFMKKNKFTKIIVIMAIICLIIFPFAHKANSAKQIKYTKIVVCSGDTLWTIASEYTDQKGDIREFIYNIKKINNLNSALITPGQELLIPELS